jgi:hypothetical protein
MEIEVSTHEMIVRIGRRLKSAWRMSRQIDFKPPADGNHLLALDFRHQTRIKKMELWSQD